MFVKKLGIFIRKIRWIKFIIKDYKNLTKKKIIDTPNDDMKGPF